MNDIIFIEAAPEPTGVDVIILSASAIHPLLPWAVLTLAIWLVWRIVRKLAPDLWERVADLPFGELAYWSPTVMAARKLWQALPSVALGALVGAAVAPDPRDAWLGAMAGAAAPVWHEILKALPGRYGQGGPVAVLCLWLALSAPVLSSCGGSYPTVQTVRSQAQDTVQRADKALAVLYVAHSFWMASIAEPTEAQVRDAERVAALLDTASASVVELDRLTRDEGDVARIAGLLGELVVLLEDVAEELHRQGVVLPTQATDALAAVREVL